MPVSLLSRLFCPKVLEFPTISIKRLSVACNHFQIPQYLLTLTGLVMHLAQNKREGIVCLFSLLRGDSILHTFFFLYWPNTLLLSNITPE